MFERTRKLIKAVMKGAKSGAAYAHEQEYAAPTVALFAAHHAIGAYFDSRSDGLPEMFPGDLPELAVMLPLDLACACAENLENVAEKISREVFDRLTNRLLNF